MRLDLALIVNWIEHGARVLDLGCGDGTLLQALHRQKQVDGLGLEIDADNITRCIAAGVNVVEQDLNKSLDNFETDSFDVVVMTHALQTLRYPHLVIDEMLRIGKQSIVTFPNFGHWRCRWYLGGHGRMPVSKFMPYTWYDTPNIHFCTVNDFEDLCAEKAIRILHRAEVAADNTQSWPARYWPNLFCATALYHITR